MTDTGGGMLHQLCLSKSCDTTTDPHTDTDTKTHTQTKTHIQTDRQTHTHTISSASAGTYWE